MKVVYIVARPNPKVRVEVYQSRQGHDTVVVAARTAEQAAMIEKVLRRHGLAPRLRRNRYEYRVSVKVQRGLVNKVINIIKTGIARRPALVPAAN